MSHTDKKPEPSDCKTIHDFISQTGDARGRVNYLRQELKKAEAREERFHDVACELHGFNVPLKIKGARLDVSLCIHFGGYALHVVNPSGPFKGEEFIRLEGIHLGTRDEVSEFDVTFRIYRKYAYTRESKRTFTIKNEDIHQAEMKIREQPLPELEAPSDED